MESTRDSRANNPPFADRNVVAHDGCVAKQNTIIATHAPYDASTTCEISFFKSTVGLPHEYNPPFADRNVVRGVANTAQHVQ